MKPNRNSIRSTRLIKEAFLKILQEKDISKISVKEVSDLADLTRNTFYAHFIDIYDVYESIEDDVIKQTLDFIDDTFKGSLHLDSLLFFKKVMNYVNQDRNQLTVLLLHGNVSSFMSKFSTKIVEHVMATSISKIIKDKKGYTIFLNILFSGAVYIISLNLDGKLNLTPDELACKLNDIYLNCYQTYLEQTN